MIALSVDLAQVPGPLPSFAQSFHRISNDLDTAYASSPPPSSLSRRTRVLSATFAARHVAPTAISTVLEVLVVDVGVVDREIAYFGGSITEASSEEVGLVWSCCRTDSSSFQTSSPPIRNTLPWSHNQGRDHSLHILHRHCTQEPGTCPIHHNPLG